MSQSSSDEPERAPEALVLLVEDNLIVALSLAIDLEEEGFRVVGPVGRVEPGLELVKNQKVDVALLDVDLQGELSFPIAEKLVEQAVPVVFISARPVAEIHQLFPAAMVVTKPFQEESVVGLVKQLVKRTG